MRFAKRTAWPSAIHGEKPMSIRLKPTIAAVVLLAVSVGNAQTPADQPSLTALSTDADLVFQGTVTGIEYAPPSRAFRTPSSPIVSRTWSRVLTARRR